MEFESEGITPPSSPIFGYSRLNDEDSVIDSGIVFCFNCKGQPRPNDFSFSPEGCILRREAITAQEILNGNTSSSTHGLDKPRLVRFFGYNFDLLDKEQLKTLIAICRKNVTSLEVLSESSHSYIPGPSGGLPFGNGIDAVAADDPDELQNQDPWALRQNICYFFNMIVRQLNYYKRVWKTRDFEDLFVGLKKSLGSVTDWSNVLRNHCGFRSGNECTSSAYHFFHLQLELRWSLFLIFGSSPSIIQWLLDDLINLSMYKYKDDSNERSLEEKQPFNCICVKELWTMVKLVIDDLKTSQHVEHYFWEFYAQSMERISAISRSDICFPIWLTSNLAQISDYTVAGVYCPGRGKEESKNGNNGYKHLHSIFKEWGNRGGKSVEVLKLSFNFLQHWGEDYETLLLIWNQWVPRLDKGNNVTHFESYSSVESWLKLILKLLKNNPGTMECSQNTSPSSHSSISTTDPFLEFVLLVAGHAKLFSEKDLKKFKVNICMKLTRSNSTDYGELGIIRVCTLFMVLMTVSKGEALATCDRLLDILSYGKRTNTTGRQKTILRAYSTMIVLLLRNECVITDAKVTTSIMKTFNEYLSQSSSSDAANKEFAMIYIELLDSLPKYSPRFGNTSLGRDTLISPNLLMWLSNCGPNHVLRTVRVLSQLTGWIITVLLSRSNEFDVSPASSEHKDLFCKIREKCLPFMKSCVLLNANRIPSTDMEPLAVLAGDITILTRHFSNSSKVHDEISYQFELFGMNERTCPIFSECYAMRLFQNKNFIANNFSDLRLSQLWVRLIALDCHIPDQLTEQIFGSSFCSTSSQSLLSEFCKREGARGKDIQTIFSPLAVLLHGVMSETLFKEAQGSAKVESENLISSVITCSSVVLSRMKFDNIYLRGDATSIGHKLLNSLILPSWPGTPPWEKFSSSIMKALETNLFDIFSAVVSFPGTTNDPYLCRKLQDIVVLSFFGFVRSANDVDKDQHPMFKTLNLCEDRNITVVQNQILPNVVAGEQVVKDIKLSQQFIRAVGLLRSKGFATPAIRVLSGLLRAYLSHPPDKINNNLLNHNIVYCCQFGLTPLYKTMIVDSFKTVLVKERRFAFNHRRVFQLCSAIAKGERPQARTFLKSEIIPMLEELVVMTEQLRGNGIDNSLRAPLQALKNEVSDVVDVEPPPFGFSFFGLPAKKRLFFLSDPAAD
ncbi:Protein MMS22-like, partial [Orchesella cincta]